MVMAELDESSFEGGNLAKHRNHLLLVRAAERKDRRRDVLSLYLPS